MVYLKSVENVITLDKLIGLLFLFCLPLLSILLLKTKRNDLARPVMGTIFLVSLIGRAKRAPHWGVQSRFRVIYICRSVGRSVGMSVVVQKAQAELRGPNARMLKVSFGR